MKPTQSRPHPHPRNRLVPITLVAILVLLWVVELLWAPHYKPVFPWHSVTGYMALIGLIGCALLTSVAKFGGKKYLQRRASPEPHRDTDGNVFEDQHGRA